MSASRRAPPGPTPNAASAFVALGVLLVPLLGVLVAWVAAPLARGVRSSFPILAASHAATLLWGTLIAMGALHQMLPAAAGISQVPGRGAAVQLGAFALGAAGGIAFATGTVAFSYLLGYSWLHGLRRPGTNR